jgi:hypothetical protein
MLYRGSVRVPKNAVAGTASLSFRLSDNSEFESLETKIEIKLIENKKD